MPKNIDFGHNWSAPDARPRIISCGVAGKKCAWIQIEHRGSIFGGAISMALLKRIRKNNNKT